MLAKLACANLEAKFSDVNLLNSETVIYLLWSAILFSTVARAVVVVGVAVAVAVAVAVEVAVAVAVAVVVLIVAKLVILGFFFFHLIYFSIKNSSFS